MLCTSDFIKYNFIIWTPLSGVLLVNFFFNLILA